jgi:hypothetical protein
MVTADLRCLRQLQHIRDLLTVVALGERRQVLLPHLAAVVIDGVVRVAGAVELWARPRAGGATCPECGKRSGRVHSRY